MLKLPWIFCIVYQSQWASSVIRLSWLNWSLQISRNHFAVFIINNMIDLKARETECDVDWILLHDVNFADGAFKAWVQGWNGCAYKLYLWEGKAEATWISCVNRPHVCCLDTVVSRCYQCRRCTYHSHLLAGWRLPSTGLPLLLILGIVIASVHGLIRASCSYALTVVCPECGREWMPASLRLGSWNLHNVLW